VQLDRWGAGCCRRASETAAPILAFTVHEGQLLIRVTATGCSTLVEAVALLADRGEFDGLEKLYAPEEQLDYTSVFGGHLEIVRNTALMTRWAGVLPGFDRTRHAVRNIGSTVDINSAIATADVVADHTLTGTGESDSRDVIARAAAAAGRAPAPYLQRQMTRLAVLDFLEGLETKDMTRVNGLWAEDAVQDMPYSPPGHLKRIVGRQALRPDGSPHRREAGPTVRPYRHIVPDRKPCRRDRRGARCVASISSIRRVSTPLSASISIVSPSSISAIGPAHNGFRPEMADVQVAFGAGETAVLEHA
jgi:hypothetical protein